jgi:hypothetical protein
MDLPTIKALEQPWTTRTLATLAIVALVVPGGSLVFAWALARRFLKRAAIGRIVDYARGRLGSGFNYRGVTLQMPVALGRRACELPLVPGAVRDACIRGLGALNPLVASEKRLFCSQLVLEAYRHADVPLADADSSILSPADILHLREGDVPSFRIGKPLHDVGHLKNVRTPLPAVQLQARGD